MKKSDVNTLLCYNYKKEDFKSTEDFERIESKIRKDLTSEIIEDYQNKIRHDLHVIYRWDTEFHNK